MTVGFGDITPVNRYEAIILAFVEIFGSMVLAYNISEIGSIIMSMRSSQQAMSRNLAIFKRMTITSKINPSLSKRIENYIAQEHAIK